MRQFRVLVVDDYEPFRRLVCSILEQVTTFQVTGQASDGLEAVQKAAALDPDLILLDIGLPKLSGIEVARRLSKLTPKSKIIFLSQEYSSDVVQEALAIGAKGYIHKPRIHNELMPALNSILAGKTFVTSSLGDWKSTRDNPAQSPHRHEVQFYSDDGIFLESFGQFISAELKIGNAAIVVATKSHHEVLLQRLKEETVDIDDAIRRGAYISLDAAETLSGLMADGLPDRDRFFKEISSLIETAAKSGTAEQCRVALCGERVGMLWADGKTDAAIRLEQLCDELAREYDVDILCAYPISSVQSESAFRKICAEHSGVRIR